MTNIVISVCLTVCCLAVVAAVLYGSTVVAHHNAVVMQACIDRGGSWLNGASCIAPRMP